MAALRGRLAKRHKQLGDISDAWDEVIPADLHDHTALESYHRGVLTVLVDSSSHRFHLQMLLAGGLKRHLQARCSAPVNKVRLLPGQFYVTDVETGQKRYGFA